MGSEEDVFLNKKETIMKLSWMKEKLALDLLWYFAFLYFSTARQAFALHKKAVDNIAGLCSCLIIEGPVLDQSKS